MDSKDNVSLVSGLPPLRFTSTEIVLWVLVFRRFPEGPFPSQDVLDLKVNTDFHFDDILHYFPRLVLGKFTLDIVVLRKFVNFEFYCRWGRDSDGLGVFGNVEMHVLSDPDREP